MMMVQLGGDTDTTRSTAERRGFALGTKTDQPLGRNVHGLVRRRPAGPTGTGARRLDSNIPVGRVRHPVVVLTEDARTTECRRRGEAKSDWWGKSRSRRHRHPARRKSPTAPALREQLHGLGVPSVSARYRRHRHADSFVVIETKVRRAMLRLSLVKIRRVNRGPTCGLIVSIASVRHPVHAESYGCRAIGLPLNRLLPTTAKFSGRHIPAADDRRVVTSV